MGYAWNQNTKISCYTEKFSFFVQAARSALKMLVKFFKSMSLYTSAPSLILCQLTDGISRNIIAFIFRFLLKCSLRDDHPCKNKRDGYHFKFWAFSHSLFQSREIKKAVENLDPQIKKTIIGLQAQGVPKEVIASRFSNVVKNKAKIHQIIDGVNQEASKNDPRKLREQAMAAKRKEIEKQNAMKKQQKKNEARRRQAKEL